jgi:ComF family protein
MNLLSKLVDLIYPPRCGVCHAFLQEDGVNHEGGDLDLCRSCFNSFAEVTSPLCPFCGRPFGSSGGEDHVCADCLATRPVFDIARAPYIYEGLLMTAIHEFKYSKRSSLARSLGPLLASYAAKWLGNPAGKLLVIPVPLHPRRLRERGFNQSLLLARHVASRLNADLDCLSLRRTRFTQPQTRLTGDERKKNVRRAFGVVEKTGLTGRSLLLIDDVATTGSTLNECARVLKKAGAKEVCCLALARTATG